MTAWVLIYFVTIGFVHAVSTATIDVTSREECERIGKTIVDKSPALTNASFVCIERHGSIGGQPK